jgi:hypothetical protein
MVKKARRKVVATKKGSIGKKGEELYGKMKGTVHFKGDITKPIRKKWDLFK